MKKISTNKILLFLSAVINIAGLVVAFCISWQAMLIFVAAWLLGNFFFILPLCRMYKQHKKEIGDKFENKTDEELQNELNKMLDELSAELKKYNVDFSANVEIKDDGIDGEVTVIDKPFEECKGEVISDIDEATLEKTPAFKKKTRRSPKKKKQ